MQFSNDTKVHYWLEMLENR